MRDAGRMLLGIHREVEVSVECLRAVTIAVAEIA